MQSSLRLAPLPVLVRVALVASITGSFTVHADTPTEPVALVLDDMVVTAAGYEQSVDDAPASMTVIDGGQLQRKSYRDLGDAVRDVEGVVVNGGANETDISIRGMPADYTLILVDGKRQSARESRVNGSSGYEQSFVPPAAAIERIEVVRGPMSSLYGSDAIGGVINVITRKVASEWGGSIGYDYSYRQHSDQGNARQTQLYLSGPLKEDLLGLQVWGRYLDRQADDDVKVSNGFSKADHRDLTARLAFTPSVAHDVLVEVGATRLKNGDGYSTNWATREQENNRDHWSLSHQARWGWATSDIALFQETSSREGRATSNQTDIFGRKPEIKNTTLDAKWVLPTAHNTSTLGMQWNKNHLTDWNQGLGDRVDYKFSVTQKALFAENEWQMTDSFALTTGVRLDHHQEYGANVSPRVYGVWHANDTWTLKGGIARGFKAPELRAVLADYAHLRRNRFVMFGNPDLKPETSTNYEFSALWSNRDDLSAGITVFYNDFKDKLSSVTTNRTWNSYIVMDRINVDKAIIQGVEFNGSWDIIPSVLVKANYTYTDSEQKSGANAGAPLALTPKQKANLRGEWTINDRAQVWTSLSYYGEETGNTVTAKVAPGYTTADIGSSYDLSKSLTLNASLNNLTDKRLDDETYGTVNYGRTLWMGATFNF